MVTQTKKHLLMKLNVEFSFFIDTEYVEIVVFYKFNNKFAEDAEI